jgi:hypothetical protein
MFKKLPLLVAFIGWLGSSSASADIITYAYTSSGLTFNAASTFSTSTFVPTSFAVSVQIDCTTGEVCNGFFAFSNFDLISETFLVTGLFTDPSTGVTTTQVRMLTANAANGFDSQLSVANGVITAWALKVPSISGQPSSPGTYAVSYNNTNNALTLPFPPGTGFGQLNANFDAVELFINPVPGLCGPSTPVPACYAIYTENNITSNYKGSWVVPGPTVGAGLSSWIISGLLYGIYLTCRRRIYLARFQSLSHRLLLLLSRPWPTAASA